MSRYAQMFERLRSRKEGAFGAFVMLGDPDLRSSLAILRTVAAAGADLIEVGIPFSDPVADGPTIQRAADRALRAGATPSGCLDILREFRAETADVPVGILTYANILHAFGREHFYRAAAASGVDSVLVADVPSIEARSFAEAARAAGVAPVLIAAPNTPRPALETIASLCKGYTYCVARAGVTGTDRAMELQHGQLFASLGELGAPPPILGFGIATPEHVRAALEAGAAGAISGSAVVEIAERRSEAELGAFIGAMKRATFAAGPAATG